MLSATPGCTRVSVPSIDIPPPRTGAAAAARVHVNRRLWIGLLIALMGLSGWAPPDAVASDLTVEERLQRAEELIEKLQGELTELKELAQTPAAHVEPARQPEPAVSESPNALRAFWKNGLRFETADRAFRARIGGRFHNDWAWGTMSDDVETTLGEDFKNGVEFRRAWIYLSGTLYDDYEYKVQYDFAGGSGGTFKDVYFAMRNVPVVGGIRVGHFKEPFSLEELTGNNYLTFIERGLPNGAFAPKRNTGVMLYDTLLDEQMTWAIGTFRETDAFGDEQSDSEYLVTGRLTGVPVYADDGRTILHLGAAARWRRPGDDSVRYRERPEVHLAPRFVDTGTIASDGEARAGAEVAWVGGPFSAQAEYFYTFVDAAGGNDPDFNGLYVYGSYFLTGEHRPYKRSSGVFGMVQPHRNFKFNGGPGAWEGALRYSQIDLRDEGIKGGELRNTTLGVNWYLNSNVRIMANWVHSHRKQVGNADLVTTRFQVFF